MEWLDQNLDAYRVVAEMLGLLRAEMHRILVRLHGDSWQKKGMPADVFARLVAAKEKERSIDWYESEYQEIIDYADFIDFLGIIEHNPSGFPHLVKLAPNAALLHARFLELEVMRAKLGRAREISEPELAFLSTFHLRLRDALAHAPDTAPQSELPQQPENVSTKDAEEEIQFEPAEVETLDPVAIAAEVSDAESMAALDAPAVGETPNDAAAAVSETQPEARNQQPKLSAIDEAIEQNDTRTILRELYSEITTTADNLWSEEPLAPPAIWAKVAVSNWYQNNISRLGLKPLSDFYEVISGVTERMHGGLSRSELQRHLKDCNFAQILLALRDMFQRNNI